MSNIVHIYGSNMKFESRIFKEAASLEQSGMFNNIWLVGIQKEGLPEIEIKSEKIKIVRIPLRYYKKIPIFKSFVLYLEWYYRIYKYFKNEKIDIIQEHSAAGLPYSTRLKNKWKAKLIFDAHELETERIELQGFRKKVAKISERIHIEKADAVFVVGTFIKDWYEKKYPKSTFYLMRNLPKSAGNTSFQPDNLRLKFNIEEQLFFIYQGSLSRGRGINVILEAFSHQRDKHVVFMGDGQLSQTIIEASKQLPNIHYHPPVNSDHLLAYTSQADVGLVLIENECLSYYYSLPNKLFEYTSAGIPIVYSDFPEMTLVMNDLQNGWGIAPNSDSLRTFLKTISRNKIEEKRKVTPSTLDKYHWEREVETYLGVVNKLLQ